MGKKHIIITKLFEFGGSNAHLKALVSYFGENNIILILENKEELIHLKNTGCENIFRVLIFRNLHSYAHLSYLPTTNVKESLFIAWSILRILFLSLKNGLASVTISAVEPEKHLYFLWIPFAHVTYILHSTPLKKYTWFTSFTANFKLSKKKRIVTVSQSNKALIINNWNIIDSKQEHVHVVHNCSMNTRLNDSVVFVQKSSIKAVITFGHLIAYKNPHLWLEVAKEVTRLREVQFHWYGDGPLLEHLQETIKESNSIKFFGYIINTDKVLESASIYYQPSLYETHGIAVLEAMNSGLPCVVSNAGGLPESVIDNFNGILVDPHNVKENIDAILQLIDNEKLRTNYGMNSFARYQELFAYDSFKNKMNAVYEK
ncbi:glycosyltransferase family 4 protein [Flavihumibacter sp. R14]|nr:glycosyltransferase family 4 protein [Flavihumibacter soli]